MQGYEIGPEAYFWRGYRNLEHARDNQFPPALFYAAFEFRCCIEQTLRVYLELLGHENWSKQLEKMYLANDLKKKILSLEPEFNKKLEFVDILIRAVGNKGAFQLDLDELDKLYGRIGGYMHAQVKPPKTVENPKWWGRFYDVLVESSNYLGSVLSHDLAQMSLSDKGWNLYDRWKSGELDEPSVMREFVDGLVSGQ